MDRLPGETLLSVVFSMRTPVVVGEDRSAGWERIYPTEINSTVNAIDAHYFSADQRWALDGQLMHSDVDGVTGSGFWGYYYAPASSRSTAYSESYLYR